eukprot:jgi/Chrpa1/16526/Chrysochromulina_OHIO_Genome00007661-RA
MASRDLNIGDVNIVLREVSHATTEPLATTLIKTLSTQILGTFAMAAPQSLVQLLHCPSSEVAAEVMLTLHDNAGGDDHAASRFMASRFAALLPDDDDAASISPRVIRFMVMLPEVLGRLVRQRFAVPPRPPYQMSAATALGIFLAWNGPGPAPTTQAPWMANLDRDMLRLGDEFGRFVASASPSPADRDAAPVDDSAVCEEDASAPLVHVIEPQLHATITRYGWSPRANALVFLGHRLSLLDSPGADALAAAALRLLPAAAHDFVLTGANSSSHLGQLRSLPGTSFRWTVPAEQANTDGLGGGLFWALDPQFCEKMLTKFPERNIFLGVDFLDVDFLNCDDIKAALLRGFATWSDNHRLLNFVDISESAPCTAANRSADLSDPCPWEVYITTDDGSAHPDLAAYVTTFRASHFDQLWFTQPLRSSSGVIAFGVDANRRSMMRFQTHICWYLDATFCYHLQRLKHESAMGTADIDLFVRLTLLMLFAMAATRMLWTLFFVCVALFCVRGEAATAAAYRRHGRCSGRCSMMLDYLSSLSPGGNVLVLFFLIFPPIFYQRIYLPCIECYDFEAAMAHETGHVLGFDHPDQRADENLVAREACAVNNATCRDAFGGTSTEEPERRRSPNAPETLMIEDMAEGEPAEVRRPPLNGYAVKGGSTASPSKVAFAESLGNGYTGPVWPSQ